MRTCRDLWLRQLFDLCKFELAESTVIIKYHWNGSWSLNSGMNLVPRTKYWIKTISSVEHDWHVYIMYRKVKEHYFTTDRTKCRARADNSVLKSVNTFVLAYIQNVQQCPLNSWFCKIAQALHEIAWWFHRTYRGSITVGMFHKLEKGLSFIFLGQSYLHTDRKSWSR